MTMNADHPHTSSGDTASKVIFGFWVYLMTDAIVFAVLFASYAVLRNNTYGGPGIQQISDLPQVLAQSILFLASVLSFGVATMALRKNCRAGVLFWLVVTFVLASLFLGMQYHDFCRIIAGGHTWQSSAFFSIFFTLLGIYSLHIIVGLLWMFVLFIQLIVKGLHPMMRTRLTCFGLFWNYLSIVWIFIFMIVYLMGAI